MTGEITLTGRILPVGGIQEKVLAAKRAKVTTIIMPAQNRVDVEELSEEIRKDITIRLVDTVAEAAEAVLRKTGEQQLATEST